jgi:hypothetical protein
LQCCISYCQLVEYGQGADHSWCCHCWVTWWSSYSRTVLNVITSVSHPCWEPKQGLLQWRACTWSPNKESNVLKQNWSPRAIPISCQIW